MSEIKWMARAGPVAALIEEFARGFIAIGWHELGDLSAVTSQEEIRERYNSAYPDEKSGKVGYAVAMIYKFRCKLEVDQKVVTYDSQSREYLIGSLSSDYYYDTDEIPDYPHLRKVDWQSVHVSRDLLSTSSKNTLGGIATLFSVNEEVSTELLSHLGEPTTPENS
jgi:restriction system protein